MDEDQNNMEIEGEETDVKKTEKHWKFEAMPTYSKFDSRWGPSIENVSPKNNNVVSDFFKSSGPKCQAYHLKQKHPYGGV
jgi:hypothetical protein